MKLTKPEVLTKNMERHIMRMHNKLSKINYKRYHDSVLVDKESHIYMISKSIQGNQYPLYIQKRVSDVDQKLMCEDQFCQDGIGMAARSKHATKSCPH